VIEKALGNTNGNKTKAAKLLGITLRSLRYRLVKLRMEDESGEEEEIL
jgi:DNA-binding NtrC family response regulator